VHNALFRNARESSGSQMEDLHDENFRNAEWTSSSVSSTFHIAQFDAEQAGYVVDCLIRVRCSISIYDISTLYTEQGYATNLHIPGRNIDGDICLYSHKYIFLDHVALPPNTDNIKFLPKSWIPIAIRSVWSDEINYPVSYTANRTMPEGDAYIHITGLPTSTTTQNLYVLYEAVDNIVCIQPDKLIVGYGNKYKYVQWSDIATKI
jgi:hypothetical protein